MKKLLYWTVAIKSFAAMFFTGFIFLYMVLGTLYGIITGESFEYSVSFTFIIQSIALSVIISLLWTAFFDNAIIKKMRYFLRLIIFSLTLLPAFGLCFFVFQAVSAEWTNLWLIIAGFMVVGLIIISLLFESYFKMIGRRYTDTLNDYKAKQG